MSAAAPGHSPDRAPSRPRLRSLRPTFPGLALAALLIVVLVPMLALLLYGASTRWDRHWWPEEPTLRWMAEAALDPRVQGAVLRTAVLALASAALALVCGAMATIPAAIAAQLDAVDGTARTARLTQLLDLLALLPFAIAPVVIAISALELFVGQWGGWLPLPLVYVAVVAPTLFPLVHKTLQSALAQLQAAALIEAGRTLGASDGHTLRRVLLPMLAPALLAAFLLAWVTAAMEFAIANLLLGGQLELLQPLMNSLRNADGHQAAALMVMTFAGVGAVVVAISRLSRRWT
ncbi:iron(III) transport system permease protein/putative spermidine/putrescine transport system permease protein [Mitsuaria sp. PDC51]|uniref:ABC transporter permease subunit n=1 Tax=Mitsuaria sp. PDC51 TaxID=1881035 RepID=UPI0008E1C4AE|nr:ABC transporter permease subunit [Mitsuaria sp. PDC51]SFR91147.1 iron(III) transport system permease protein/putative spermidine/putrescine transport system permease protein [Mitsuaria sp. PDC51]